MMGSQIPMCPENYDELVAHTEEVYGNAYWALRNGADRESLISQIDAAIEMLQEELQSGQPLYHKIICGCPVELKVK